MRYGLAHLAQIPQRAEAADTSELVNQVLYGEVFKVLERRRSWSRIRLSHDGYEGWVDNKQYQLIEELQYDAFAKATPHIAVDFLSEIERNDYERFPVYLGSTIRYPEQYQGKAGAWNIPKAELQEVALYYSCAPYLWGGRTPAGIDCSGLTQMIYRIAGHSLPRDASQQVEEGVGLSFVQEAEPGDLAFFDNDEGRITHVGMIMDNARIIHAHGHVRIDVLDQTGIFNVDTGKHSHKLRIIKRIID